MTFYMCVATFAYLLMGVGFFFRKQKKIHIPLVSLAIFLDILIVLILELERDAILTAVSFELSMTEQLHILFSTLALICYFPMIYLGVRLARRTATHYQKIKNIHRTLGTITFVFRSIGFVFMFSLLQ